MLLSSIFIVFLVCSVRSDVNEVPNNYVSLAYSAINKNEITPGRESFNFQTSNDEQNSKNTVDLEIEHVKESMMRRKRHEPLDENEEEEEDISDNEKIYSIEKDDLTNGNQLEGINDGKSSQKYKKRKVGNKCPTEFSTVERRDAHEGPKIWDQWGKWSSCSVSCGFGKLTRWRFCVAGGCSNGEKEAQFKTCTFPACPNEPKIWDQWGKWSCCSATCGKGKITRWRHCLGGGCASGQKEAQLKACRIKDCR